MVGGDGRETGKKSQRLIMLKTMPSRSFTLKAETKIPLEKFIFDKASINFKY